MMIRVQSGGLKNPPEMKEADSVVIMTNEGIPIAVALDYHGGVLIKTAADTDFEETMKFLGFSKRLIPEVRPLIIDPKDKLM